MLWCKEEQQARAEWHKDVLLHINGGEIKGERERLFKGKEGLKKKKKKFLLDKGVKLKLREKRKTCNCVFRNTA